MKDWVLPFLRKNGKTAESEVEVFNDLIDYLNTDFGSGLGEYKDTFISAFGSILADLPEDVFKSISAKDSILYTFTPFPGAEAKCFTIESDMKEGDMLKVFTFPFSSVFFSVDVLRGAIVHELAHIYAEHEQGKEDDQEADEIARGWGFQVEIDALKEYREKKDLYPF